MLVRRLFAAALRRGPALIGVAGSVGVATAFALSEPASSSRALPAELEALSETDAVVTNWSGTHSASPSAYFTPDSLPMVERIVQLMSDAKRKLRVVGSALSPNGLGLSDDAMLNMALCDKILSIDTERRMVTVEAGARVKEVVEALRPHGLTLQNYASIDEQQIGGFTQMGAHGTGARIPPVDEQVVGLTLLTPAAGTLHLSEQSDPALFRLAKVGLGALGVVTEVTLQCVPAHRLVQHTYVDTREGVAARHAQTLRAHRHARYMWIPHTDAVVVVTCDPLPDGVAEPQPPLPPPPDEAVATAPLRELLCAEADARGAPLSEGEVRAMSFAQLRDALLALEPLCREHVVAINRAEAEFWKRSQAPH